MSNILDKYRKIYGNYNRETLKVAANHDPDLIKKIILDLDIKGFSRSFAILALAEGAREEHFEFIKQHVQDTCPFMREASFMGLFEYHCYEGSKYPYLKTFFEDCLDKETGDGVREQIKSLLEDWESWTDIYKED